MSAPSTARPSFPARVADSLRTELLGIATLSKQVVASGAYTYPVRGAVYFGTHRELWAPLTARLLPLMGVSTAVIAAMFLFTYIPQSFVLQFVNGPLAWITTIPLVLGESATLVGVIVRQLGWHEQGLVDVFDAVLIQKNQQSLVSNGREVSTTANKSNPIRALGKPKRPLHLPSKLNPVAMVTNYLLTLPLNFIPVIGTAIFVAIQGRRLGPTLHERYFVLKGWDAGKRRGWINEDKGGYLGFGIVAFAFTCVPVVGLLLAYANEVGAALWAVDIEEGKYKPGRSGETAGRPTSGAVKSRAEEATGKKEL